MALIVPFLVTLAITPAVARLAVLLDVVDRPGPLKLQRAPIPYLGGVAVALGMVGPVAVAWPAALIPLGLALALGLADDRAALPLTVRLPCEVAIGLAAVAVVPGLHLASGALLVVGLVLLLNATNLLDGLDGLAGGTVAAGAIGFAVLAPDGHEVLALALAGALAGFLVWNRPPARIYLGDAGSYLLGTALALLLASMVNADDLGLSRSTPALLFIAAPAADTIVAIVRRYRAGQPLVRGDRGHIYDQLLARGVPAPWVTVTFVVAQSLLVAIGLAIATLPSEVAWLATAAVIGVVSVAVLAAFTDPNVDWADNSPVVDVLGTAVRIEAPPKLQRQLRPLVAGLVTGRPATRVLALEPSPGRAGLVLVEDGTEVMGGIGADVAAATVIWRLNEHAASAEGYQVIHAGVVARGQRAVILPGRSGAGKTELCAACIREGFTYLSDEQAALDRRSGLLSPYAKPLGIGDRVVAPAEIGPLRPTQPTPPAAIVFPNYHVAAIEPAPSTVPPSLALLGLCAHAKHVDREGFLWLAGLARTCPTLSVTYARSADAIAVVEEALAAAPAHPQVRPARPMRSGPHVEGVTAVAMDDEVVLFRAETSTVHHLNRSAAFIWRTGARARGEALVRACLEDAPDGALEADEVRATVAWLASSGLLPDDGDALVSVRATGATMIPWSEAELHAGLVAGAAGTLAVLAVLVLRVRRAAPDERPPPWPYGGLVVVAAGLAAVHAVDPVPWDVLLGVVGVTAAVDLVAATGRPTWWRAAAALPFALLIATADALPRLAWFQVLVAVAVAGGGALAAATDTAWRDEAVAPILLAVTAAGTYAAVPDTELALAVVGVALWFAVLAFPWPLARLGAGGAAGAVALVVWAAAFGARGRPAALVGAVACLGLLAVLPLGARLGAGMGSALDGAGLRARVVVLGVVQVAVALLAARTAGLQSSVAKAVAFTLPPATIAVALATVLQPPRRPSPARPRPAAPLRTGPSSGS